MCVDVRVCPPPHYYDTATTPTHPKGWAGSGLINTPSSIKARDKLIALLLLFFPEVSPRRLWSRPLWFEAILISGCLSALRAQGVQGAQDVSRSGIAVFSASAYPC